MQLYLAEYTSGFGSCGTTVTLNNGEEAVTQPTQATQPTPPEKPGGQDTPPEKPSGENTPPDKPGGQNPPPEMTTQAQSSTVTLNASETSTGTELWYAWTWNEGEEGVWVKGSGSNASSVTFTGCRTNIIFVRMNPDGTTVPSWDAVWNKTDDLTTQPGKTFTTTGWSGEYMLGSWG